MPLGAITPCVVPRFTSLYFHVGRYFLPVLPSAHGPALPALLRGPVA
jgi:hypothetical protein